MNIVYTAHAEWQIIERKIAKMWIEETVNNPDSIGKEGKKYYAVKKLNSHTLKVVYFKEKYINVITCFFIQ